MIFFTLWSILLTFLVKNDLRRGQSRMNTNKSTSLLVQGDVRGTDSDVSMTAFCLIAMQESRRLCTATVAVSTRLI